MNRDPWIEAAACLAVAAVVVFVVIAAFWPHSPH